MLGVILLPAFIRLGHKCQSLLSPCDENACVLRLDLGLYSHPKEFRGNGVRTQVNSKEKISYTRKNLRGVSNPRRCITQDSEPSTLRTSYSSPSPTISNTEAHVSNVQHIHVFSFFSVSDHARFSVDKSTAATSWSP